MAKRKGGGGGVVLVIFLIFFILLSIGLGVSTYLGFSQDDDKAGQVKKKEKELTDMTAERDWYKFQTLSYRAAMGHFPNNDAEKLVQMRDLYEKGALSKKEEKDEIKTLMATLDTTLGGWDKDQKHWKTTYEDLVAAQKKDKEQAANNTKMAQDLQQKDKTRADAAEELQVRKEKEHDAAYTALLKKSDEDLAKLLDENAKLKIDLNKLSVQMEDNAKKYEQEKKEIANVVQIKEVALAQLRSQLAVKVDALKSLQEDRGLDVANDLKLDWKVVRIDGRAETAYINLGSADKVQPRLTFRVHGIGEDGRPLQKDKASLEVMSVLGEHLSQAKITYDKLPRESPRHDPTHNPVVSGDIIINPSWHPNRKKHIALAGVVDLTGSGRDDTESFIRSLEQQNIVVDAYLDLKKDFTIKGPGISVQTDYLILGDAPREVLGGPAKEIQGKIKERMDEMSKQAKENGVRVRPLRQYLEEIGYRVPGNTETHPPVIDVRGDGPKGPPMPKDPMMKDDKPMPDK